MPSLATLILVAVVFNYHVSALLPRDVQGSSYLSPLKGQKITNLTGVVTAVGSSGFYLQSPDGDGDDRTSEGVYVYGSSAASRVSVGQLISLSGTASEYQSSSSPSYLHLTELVSPSAITVLQSGVSVSPVVIGVDRTPPTERIFVDDGLAVPNNTTQVESVDELDVANRGLDFWESLEGMLVTIPNVNAISRTNSYGEVWITGRDFATGLNSQGGLTMGYDDTTGIYDLNPEAIWVWPALDGTDAPSDLVIGSRLEDVTGVVGYSYGYFVIYPLTAVAKVSSPDVDAPATTLTSASDCSGLVVGTYNLENLMPTDAGRIAQHASIITTKLGSPALLGVQEIQDGSGDTDDGNVSSAPVLDALTAAILQASGPNYSWVAIDPVDDADGGQPGGNIRQAWLYRTDLLALAASQGGAGGATDSQSVSSVDGAATFYYNPGRIAPTDAAWRDSRKPLSAAFEVRGCPGAGQLLVINLHLTSKLDSTSYDGEYQPAVNGGVSQRISQAAVVSDFVKDIFAAQQDAKVILVGDMNEFTRVEPLDLFEGVLTEILVRDRVERYSYQYDASCQQLDHIFVSDALLNGAASEHVHSNNWRVESEAASDHDPYIARIVLE